MERFTKAELEYNKSFLKQLVFVVTDIEYDKKVRDINLLIELRSRLVNAGYRIKSITRIE